MEQQRESRSFPERKGQKRKLEEGPPAAAEDPQISPSTTTDAALLSEVAAQVSVLNSAFSWKESDRAAAKRAAQVLGEHQSRLSYLASVFISFSEPSMFKQRIW